MGASKQDAFSDEKEEKLETPPPYKILHPNQQTSLVIYASPHSGNQYPKAFVEQSLLDPISLRRSEDAFVDELYDTCTQYGSPLLKANFPRAYVDPNREPYELDPSMFDGKLPSYVNTESQRALAGLGTVAKVVTNGSEIYRDKLLFGEIKQRIDSLYHPYHAALQQLIEKTHQQFGTCLLIDCHSMPSIGGPMDTDMGTSRTDIILGDRFGTSCDGWITDFVHETLLKEGFVVKRNRPYAGGFTTQHYSNPQSRTHVLQIELNRDLYMDEENITRLPELIEIKAKLHTLVKALSEIKAVQF